MKTRHVYRLHHTGAAVLRVLPDSFARAVGSWVGQLFMCSRHREDETEAQPRGGGAHCIHLATSALLVTDSFSSSRRLT
jgi:hypothetical protein